MHIPADLVETECPRSLVRRSCEGLETGSCDAADGQREPAAEQLTIYRIRARKVFVNSAARDSAVPWWPGAGPSARGKHSAAQHARVCRGRPRLARSGSLRE